MNGMQGGRAPRVLIFDSGIGGLSIAQAIDQRMPCWKLVYLADNAFFPYGDQPEQVVIERCLRLITGVVAQTPVDMIVIGCNTASTVVLPALRAAFSCPVIGVVPAIKPAAALSRNGRIGLLATPATVRRPYLDNLIREFAGNCHITRIGSSELVQLTEGWMGTGELAQQDRERILMPLREAGVDTVVLGCTHFPLIRPLLKPVLAADVAWVDSGDAIARRVAYLWSQARMGSDEAVPADAVSQFFFSGDEPAGLRRWLRAGPWSKPGITSGFALPPAYSRAQDTATDETDTR